MATYKDIQREVKNKHGFVPKTCWIAHIRSDYGLTKHKAHNRIDGSKRKHPCPPDKRPAIEQAMRSLKMIS